MQFFPEATKEEARRLYRRGIKVREIAKKLGASPSTVNYWVHPDSYERYLRNSAARRRERTEALQAKEARMPRRTRDERIADLRKALEET